jgi:hypothetical protein
MPKHAGDAAIEALARQYARTLDAGRSMLDLGADSPLADLAAAASLHDLGAGFRAVLVEMGLTPKARAAIMRGQPEESKPTASPLDELRKRRERVS